MGGGLIVFPKTVIFLFFQMLLLVAWTYVMEIRRPRQSVDEGALGLIIRHLRHQGGLGTIHCQKNNITLKNACQYVRFSPFYSFSDFPGS